MNWYLKVIRNYFDFEGRARRKEYWMFALFNTIFLIAAAIIDNLLGITMGIYYYGVFYILYGLITAIPNLAVSIRRLHDVNKNGWMILIGIIPIIGAIWLLVLFCTDGTTGVNQYGNNPKEPDLTPELNLYTE